MKQFFKRNGILIIFLIVVNSLFAQEVPILNSSVDSFGCIQIQVNSASYYYYLLHCKPDLSEDEEWIVSITLGNDSITTITEPLKAYPIDHYHVTQHSRNRPEDSDGDGINDMIEFVDLGRNSPLNSAKQINRADGVIYILDRETFEELSYKGPDVSRDQHLKDLEFVKFFILNSNGDNPQIYFMNTNNHRVHVGFAEEVGLDLNDFSYIMKGEIVYHPGVIAPSGQAGVYRFEFEPNDFYSFKRVKKAYEFLASNMPFLKNNWTYYPMPNAALPRYYEEKELYDNSRVAILLDKDIYGAVNFMPLNIAEGFGLLKIMDLEERPNPRDIVIYEALPNELSRVGGIITTVPQTPLSHVNLRAIQDNVPNAYITDFLDSEFINELIGKYVYYKVQSEGYELREATLAEVEAHYADIRPLYTQYPERNLSITEITPLDNIDFNESTSFGVKAANVATMRKLGFPDGTIPDGFVVPFYFYDEFMKYNGFYSVVSNMLSNIDFVNDYDVQEVMLSNFRDEIKKADMPQWMMDELDEMHKSFPLGTSVRCRSSTNNEDLPGFSGAGLYDSKTQHPDEGHISKSIKQVYASLWNFRAFDERQFYRIDHFSAAMGVLCHPNFSNELANGVGVTTDPIYGTEETYYLNTQLGEDLVTNPEALSIPEEILLDAKGDSNPGYSIIRYSNLMENGKQLLSEQHLDEMRDYLGVIHNEFKILYEATEQSDFAMEIEYKITSQNVLSIKQARPWVVNEFNNEVTSVKSLESEEISLRQNYPNPFSFSTTINFSLGEQADVTLSILDVLGNHIKLLANKNLHQGNHSLIWNGTDDSGYFVSDGLYLCRLITNNDKKTSTKIILMSKMN